MGYDEEVLEGVVHKIDKEKGFGWIRIKGTYYFFHRSGCKCSFDHLDLGEKVTFISTDVGKGPRAEDVDYA